MKNCRTWWRMIFWWKFYRILWSITNFGLNWGIISNNSIVILWSIRSLMTIVNCRWIPWGSLGCTMRILGTKGNCIIFLSLYRINRMSLIIIKVRILLALCIRLMRGLNNCRVKILLVITMFKALIVCLIWKNNNSSNSNR